MVVVVAGYRFGAILMATPGRSIAVRKLGGSTIRVDIVTHGKNGAGNIIEKFCRRLVILAATVSDVACPHENRVAPLSRSEEHTSELQSQSNLVCRLLLEKKKN